MKRTIAVLLLLCLMAVCLTGCRKKAEPVTDKARLAEDMASAQTQSAALKASLETDELTQNEMNQKSGELRSLWESAMSRMLEEAKKALPAADMEKLTAEQEAWLASTETAAKAAGKDFEGGSMYALAVNMEAASLAEARVYELYELLK